MADANTKVIISAVDQTKAAIDSAKAGVNSLATTINSLPGFGGIAASLAALASVASIKSLVGDTIAWAASMDDMAESTGSTVESLSALAAQAKISGVDMATVEAGIIKLNKALAGGDDAAKGAAHALESIGLKTADLRQMDPAEAYRTIAEALNQYADGGSKTAIIMDILGKTGAAHLPLMKDLAEAGRLNAKVTTEEAAAAEQLEKAWRLTSAEGASFSKRLVIDLVPTLASLVDYINLTKMGIVQIGSSLAVVANDILTFVKVAAAAIGGGFTDEGQAYIKEQLAKRNRFIEAANEDAEKRLTSFTSLRDKIDATLAGGGTTKKLKLPDYTSRDPKDPKEKKEPKDKGGNAWFDEAIHQIDAANKATEDFVRSQRLVAEKMDFETGLVGKSANERARLTAIRAIDNEVALKSIAMTNDQREELRRLADVMSERLLAAYDRAAEAREKWQTGAQNALAKYKDELADVAKFTEDALTRAFKGMEDALVNFVKTGKLDFKSLADSIVTDLIRIQVQQSIMKPIAEAGGLGGLMGGIGKLFGLSDSSAKNGGGSGDSVWMPSPEAPSFAGGGYTGGGSRSGGLDGQGGFMAMLHPQETVIDHARGGGSGAPNVAVNIINQSGQPVTGKQQGGPQFDGSNWVISVVMEAAGSNPGFRAAMGLGR